MKKAVKCEYNMDTGRVELLYDDGTMLAVDVCAVEREFAETWLDRRELDYLIYYHPFEYVELVLTGDVKAYLDTVRQGQ